MNEDSLYPEYIGITDVSTRSAEMMRVEDFLVVLQLPFPWRPEI